MGKTKCACRSVECCFQEGNARERQHLSFVKDTKSYLELTLPSCVEDFISLEEFGCLLKFEDTVFCSENVVFFSKGNAGKTQYLEINF